MSAEATPGASPALRRVEIAGAGQAAADGTPVSGWLCAENVLLVRTSPPPRDPRGDVVIGCPHHARKGVPVLYPSRVSDENAGLLALEVAKDLGARAVIACCSRTHDPNKVDGPYLEEVLRPPVRALVEIHGHRGLRGRTREGLANHDVEVSTGAEATQDLAVPSWSGSSPTAPGSSPATRRRRRGRRSRSAGRSQGSRSRRGGGPLLAGDADRLPPAGAGAGAPHAARRAAPGVRLAREHDGLPAAGVVFSALLSAALADVLGIALTSDRVRRARGTAAGGAPQPP